MTRPHRHQPQHFAMLERELGTPSLYDEAIQLLGRRGYAIDTAALARDWTQPYTPQASVESAWLTIYQAPDAQWDLYELAEELVDLEDAFRQWRFRHVTTVERIIGYKRGTGGTAGVSYLKQVLEIQLFPELWKVRTDL
jgi:tryptophan 2,3-dioxygenase